MRLDADDRRSGHAAKTFGSSTGRSQLHSLDLELTTMDVFDERTGQVTECRGAEDEMQSEKSSTSFTSRDIEDSESRPHSAVVTYDMMNWANSGGGIKVTRSFVTRSFSVNQVNCDAWI